MAFAGMGGMFAPKDKAASKAKSAAISQVCRWLEEMLPDEERLDTLPGGKAEDGAETSIICNQLACREDDCPDVELVITLIRQKPRPKLMFKIYKAAVDLTKGELRTALVQAEEAESQGGGE